MSMLRRRHATLNASRALGGIAALGIAYLVVRSLPELIRYLRMQRM